MSTASKSPRKVAAVAMAIGDRMLPEYGHQYSRHDFQLSQLFACLVLRKFFRVDYRGIVAIIEDCSDIRKVLRLSKTPHFTTLQKAERRLLADDLIRKYLTQTVEAFYDKNWLSTDVSNTAHSIELAAADSTGFMLNRASRYFVCRRARSTNLWQATTYRTFAKLGIIIDCDTHLILGTHRGMGPRPDVDELQSLLDGMCSNAVPQKLVADGGYDSQYNHQLLREIYNIESLIPAVHGQPTTRLPINRWRYLMATEFDEETYGQRWQVETVMFMLKQHQGAALTAHTYQTRRREMGLMAVTHNIMIIRSIKLFYKACLTPSFPPRYLGGTGFSNN
ncbi:MAG: transposase [Planctomycetes bacterium]|nr:transposase [Planctomycetota bacterium]